MYGKFIFFGELLNITFFSWAKLFSFVLKPQLSFGEIYITLNKAAIAETEGRYTYTIKRPKKITKHPQTNEAESLKFLIPIPNFLTKNRR